MTARMKAQRFPMLISPLWRYVLMPLGVTPERCFVEIAGEKLHVRFGRVFDHRFPLAEVESATFSHWPVWAGIGPRYFRGTVGLIGTYVNTIEIRFREPQKVRMLVPVSCRRLFLSVEEPRALVVALGGEPVVVKAA